MYTYNDGLLPGGRRPRLYLARGGEAVKFEGQNIPGFCAVATAQYTKAGKWSHTVWGLELAPGVRPILLVSPLHSTWGDDLPSWAAAAERLALPLETAQAIVRAEYPKTAARLDALEAFAAEVETGGAEAEVVIISFGSPTHRAVAEGYWEAPKSGRTADGAVEVVVQPGPDGWAHPEVVTPAGARILSVRHTPGYRGGTWSVEVAVPVSPRVPTPAGA